MTDGGWRFPVVLYATVLAVLLVVSWQTTAHVVENQLRVKVANLLCRHEADVCASASVLEFDVAREVIELGLL